MAFGPGRGSPLAGSQALRVLAGDIGGTKTLLSIMEVGKVAPPRARAEQRFDSRAFEQFADLLRAFLEQHRGEGPIEAACFAVAGPVERDQVKVTNLPWHMTLTSIRAALGTDKARLINDFQAIGYGIDGLREGDLAPLQPAPPSPQAPRAVIGAGTGLGQSILVWQNDHYEPLATEGGHADFGPTDEQEIDLLRYLQGRLDHVSYERLLSGPGLTNIYAFLRQQSPHLGDPGVIAAVEQGDAGAHISEAALAGQDPLAERALDMFVAIYGAQAGNLALACLASGGVYIGGGIAPKILSRLKSGRFMQAFRSKGRMSELLAKFPVQVITNPKVGLLGAAVAASRL
jgi:glucokinase